MSAIEFNPKENVLKNKKKDKIYGKGEKEPLNLILTSGF